LTNEFDARRIIYTCISIGLDIYHRNPRASFAFAGAPTNQELAREEKYKSTKRLKVYQNFAYFFFDPNQFEHHIGYDLSTYIMYNKRELAKIPNLIGLVTGMFDNMYELNEMFGS
jgi:hypothetical protein